jgi:transposase
MPNQFDHRSLSLLTKPQLVSLVYQLSERLSAVEETLAQMSLENANLKAQNQALSHRVQELEARLAKDSHNSGKPPSSDGLARKPKSLRPKGDKPTGGQPGHPGSTLCLSEHPNKTVKHAPAACAGCGRSLKDVASEGFERRQVYDLPPLALRITEHRAISKTCPACRRLNCGSFPGGVTQPVQYGPGVRALCIYLQVNHLLPFERTQQIFSDLFGGSLCQGSLANFQALCHERLEGVETAIKEAVTQAAVVHFDETGGRIGKTLHWLHVAATDTLTYYAPHEKRGRPALEAIGVLPSLWGTAVHDAWVSYFAYGCRHSLCNAHLLRELTFIDEQMHQPWARAAIALLCDIKKAVEAAKTAGGGSLSPQERLRYLARYQWVIKEGLLANPPGQRPPQPKRGRPKQSPARNLLDRMDRYRSCVLAFMDDFAVPFDNNLAERDLRMVKVQQKVSGCFRTLAGARQFCRIRGYISTLRKQGIDVLSALRSIFAGLPLMPALQA